MQAKKIKIITVSLEGREKLAGTVVEERQFTTL